MRFLYRVNRGLGFGPLPIARLVNDAKTEEYVLRNDGLVVIQSVDSKDKSIDILPITLISEDAVRRFAEQLNAD